MSQTTDPNRQLPVAGWYADPDPMSGGQRYWDGHIWTEQVRSSAVGAASAPSKVSPPGSLTSESFWKKKWFIGAISAVLGILIGSGIAGSSNVEDNPQYQSMQERVQTVEAESEDLKIEAEQFDAREELVSAAEANSKEEAADLEKREKAVGIAEKKKAANTVSGDGTYIVGEDMNPGTYKSKGTTTGNCYFAVLRKGDGSLGDIINNNNSSGSSVAIAQNGQVFQTNGCEDWVKN